MMLAYDKTIQPAGGSALFGPIRQYVLAIDMPHFTQMLCFPIADQHFVQTVRDKPARCVIFKIPKTLPDRRKRTISFYTVYNLLFIDTCIQQACFIYKIELMTDLPVMRKYVLNDSKQPDAGNLLIDFFLNFANNGRSAVLAVLNRSPDRPKRSDPVFFRKLFQQDGIVFANDAKRRSSVPSNLNLANRNQSFPT
nr:hypothetical protein [Paenibacillus ginsengarvi]